MQPTVEENRTSTRQQGSGYKRVLDTATRDRRLKKRLEALDADNHQKEFVEKDEPVKKKQRLFVTEDFSPEPSRKSSEEKEEKKSATKKKRKSTVFQRRKLKTFAQLLDDERHRIATDPESKDKPSYFTISAKPSTYPPRRFCEVCGNFSKYICITCGSFYCQVKCLNTHKETRCLKWTA